MGVIVGVRLTIRIARILGIHINSAVFRSDSVNVLWWVRDRSHNFKSFVANGVGEIQTSTDPKQWQHVPTIVNPADMLGRGKKAAKLANSYTWWRGLAFLLRPEST